MTVPEFWEDAMMYKWASDPALLRHLYIRRRHDVMCGPLNFPGESVLFITFSSRPVHR